MNPKFYAIASRRIELVNRPNVIASLLDQLDQE
jgi:hypothetical protein